MTRLELARFIDQTLLSPCATEDEVASFCEEAKARHFAAVCVNPRFVSQTVAILNGTDTRVCTVIDFPLGAGGIDSKTLQADLAISSGAGEVDYVVDLSLVKAHEWQRLSNELTVIAKSAAEAAMFSEKRGQVTTKLILETCYLADDEIVQCCLSAKSAGFDFVKTSTGFAATSSNGATLHAVELMRRTVGDAMGVKASGGIRTTQQALDFIAAGANRLGTSSGVKILEGLGEILS